MSSNGSAERTTVRSGPYLIQIDGLPPGYTWQNLKDLVRPKASHSVWTDVAINFRSQPSSQKGYVKLKLRDETAAAYRYLEGQIVGGRRLRVELWDITAPPPILLTRNYEPAGSSNLSYQTQEVARLAQDQSSWIAISPTSPASSSSSAYSTAPVPPVTYTSPPMQVVPQYVVQAMPSALQSQQQTQAYYAQAQLTALRNQQAQQIAAQQARVQSTPYATSSSGLPVNMRNGGAVTEYRAVFVNRLNYKTTERDIMGLFSKAGKIVSCKLVKESKTQKSRGHAQIEYDTAAEAQRAVDLFNEKPFQGMSLIVRLDKNATTVSPPPRSDSRPVIVDSSVASRASPAVLDGFQRLSLN